MRKDKQIQCPVCRSEKCIPGGLRPLGEEEFSGNFYPLNVKYFIVQPSVPIRSGHVFNACLNCGLLWSNIDSQKLRQLLLKRGRNEENLTMNDNPKEILTWTQFLIALLVIFTACMLFFKFA